MDNIWRDNEYLEFQKKEIMKAIAWPQPGKAMKGMAPARKKSVRYLDLS